MTIIDRADEDNLISFPSLNDLAASRAIIYFQLTDRGANYSRGPFSCRRNRAIRRRLHVSYLMAKHARAAFAEAALLRLIRVRLFAYVARTTRFALIVSLLR